MPKRSVTWGVLLFSFSMILLSYTPQMDKWSISFSWTYYVPEFNIPILVYKIMAGISGTVSLFLVISAFWEKWSNNVEEFIIKYTHTLIFVIYWFSFIMGYFKGVGSLITDSKEPWMIISFFYLGLILFLIIPAHYIKWLIQRNKTISKIGIRGKKKSKSYKELG